MHARSLDGQKAVLIASKAFSHRAFFFFPLCGCCRCCSTFDLENPISLDNHKFKKRQAFSRVLIVVEPRCGTPLSFNYLSAKPLLDTKNIFEPPRVLRLISCMYLVVVKDF